jgi:hypothetical protein
LLVSREKIERGAERRGRDRRRAINLFWCPGNAPGQRRGRDATLQRDRITPQIRRRRLYQIFPELGTGGSRVKNLVEKIAAIRERRARHKDMLAELDRTGESKISLTDPDSRAMAAHTHIAVGYNVQIAVDAKHKLIVEQQVTNQVVDMGLLAQTAEPAKEVLGVERIAVVADRGYFKIEDIEACEKAGIDPYVPRPQRGPSVRAG